MFGGDEREMVLNGVEIKKQIEPFCIQSSDLFLPIT